MPLIKSSSEPAFKANVKNLIHDVGKSPHVNSRKQALAIAYSVKRRNRAFGGQTPWFAKAEAHSLGHVGPIHSIVPGRTDNHKMSVPGGSYVLPADHVSSLGQGNTSAGMAVLGHMFGGQGPYGVGKDMAIKHGAGAPAAPKIGKLASGGGSDKGGGRGQHGAPVPIMAAGGEYVLSPEQVSRIGGGDIKRGHAILDHWVVSNRKKHVKTLTKLPGPAKS